VTFAVDDAKASGAPHLSGVTVTDLDGEATVGPLTLPSGRYGVLTYPNADPGQQKRKQFRLVCDAQPEQPEQPGQPPVAAIS
jgi:hypothetical protein